MLTVEKLESMEPNSIFATGEFCDNSMGINFFNTGRQLRWVACRGGIADWTIYVGASEQSTLYIQRHGDKIHNMDDVSRLVNHDADSAGRYRH